MCENTNIRHLSDLLAAGKSRRRFFVEIYPSTSLGKTNFRIITQPQESVELPRESVECSRESVELPRESVECSREFVELPRESVECSRESVELPRESVEHSRESVELPRESVECSREFPANPERRFLLKNSISLINY